MLKSKNRSKKNLKKNLKKKSSKKKTNLFKKKGGLNEEKLCNIVSIDEFKNYLNKSEYKDGKKQISLIDPFIDYKTAIKYKKERFSNFNSYESNRQFNSICNPKSIGLLKEMLGRFIPNRFIESIIKMIRDNNSDLNILEQIKNIHSLNKNQIEKTTTEKKNSHVKTIKITNPGKIIYDILVNNSLFSNDKQNINLLDIGCGNGLKLKHYSEQIIKASNNRISVNKYASDIANWGPYIINDNKININSREGIRYYESKKTNEIGTEFRLIQLDPYKITYEDNMFDCITLIVTLHHCKNINDVIVECKRMLKQNGIIFVVEHDVWSDRDNIIIDIQHSIYREITEEKKNSFYLEGNGSLDISCYFNCIEWDIIFERHNMKNIYTEEFKKKLFNYDKQFIAVYKKMS